MTRRTPTHDVAGPETGHSQIGATANRLKVGSGSARRPPSAGWGLILVLIGLAGVALRFVGLSWGLPYPLHPDESVILARVATMSWNNLNPGFFMYPGLFIYQVFGLSRVVFALGGESQDLIYAARLLTAIYSLATVGFVYLLGTRLGGRRLGVIGAGLAAGMGALTLHAHYAVTDTPATALATATLWLSVRAWQRRSYAEIAAAAAIAGLAVSTKYSAAPVCFVPWLGFMALAASDRAAIAKRLAGTAVLAAISVTAFLLTSPFTLIDYPSFLEDIAVESHLQARARAGYHVDPLENPGWRNRGLVSNTAAAYADLGPVAFVLALGAALYVLARLLRSGGNVARGGPLRNGPGSGSGGLPRGGSDHRGRGSSPDGLDVFPGLMVLTWLVLYFAFMAPSALGGQRYMLPAYPALILLAAVALDGLARALRQTGGRRRASVAIGILIMAVAGPSLVAAFSSTRLLAQRDTRLVARDWIVANLEQRSHLAREYYAPPIHTADNFRLSQPFSLTEHPLETYCKEDVDFLVLSSLNADRYLDSNAERFAEERAWYDRLDTRTRVVHHIEGKGSMELHHPAIEIRRLFCPQNQDREESR